MVFFSHLPQRNGFQLRSRSHKKKGPLRPLCNEHELSGSLGLGELSIDDIISCITA